MSNNVKTIDLTTLTNGEYSITDETSNYVFEKITSLNKADELTLNFREFVYTRNYKKIGNDLKFEYFYDDLYEDPSETIPEEKTLTITFKDYFNACNKISIMNEGDTDPTPIFPINGEHDLQVFGTKTVYGTNQSETIYTGIDENGNKIISDDIIYTGKGYDTVIAGKGNDTIHFDTDKGAIINVDYSDDYYEEESNVKTLKFGMGDGNDTVYLKGADDIYIEFESVETAGLGEEAFNKLLEEWEQNPDSSDEDYPSSSLKVLAYKRDGNDLIISSPTLEDNKKDTVTIKDFYSNENKTNIYIANYNDGEPQTLNETLAIYAHTHNEKDLVPQKNTTINFATILEEGQTWFDVDDDFCDYVFEGVTDLESNFTLTLKDEPILGFPHKIGDDIKFDCSYLIAEYDNTPANLPQSTVIYETENGYTTQKPTSGEYIIIDKEEFDFYYDSNGMLTTDSSEYIYNDFTITIKNYFKTDYINNEKIILQYNDECESINKPIFSIFDSVTVFGQGLVKGSDLDDYISTDKDEHDNKIINNDTIYTGKGSDEVYPGQGNDIIHLDKGTKTLFFDINDGNNVIYLNGADKVTLFLESAYTAGLGYDKFYELKGESYNEETDTYDETCPKSSTSVLSFKKNDNDLIIISPTLSGKNDTITIKDYFNPENHTNINIELDDSVPEEGNKNSPSLKDILADYGEIPPYEEDIEYTESDYRVYNKKGVEVAKNDKIVLNEGDFAITAGKGNDTITLNKGNMLLNFAKGDGTDTVYLNETETLVLNFDSVNLENIDVLSYQKRGDDLVIVSPSGAKKDDNVIIKNYFTQTNNTDIYIGNTTAKTELDSLLQQTGIVLEGSSKSNNTFVDTEYNDTINGGKKVDKITLNGQGNDIVKLNSGNDIITFNELYKNDNNLSISTGKGIKTFDVSAINNTEIIVTKNNNDLELKFNVDNANDITIDDYFKSGAILSLKDANGTRTVKYGAGKVSGTKGDDIVFASADRKGKINVSTLTGDDNIKIDVQKGNKITVSSGDGNDYIKLETANLRTSGKDNFTANLNGGKGDDTYDLTDVDLAKGKIVVNMKDGSDTLMLTNDTSFGGYSSTTSDFSYKHTINNDNSIITNNYHSFDYSNDLTLFFDVKLDKRGVSYGYNRTGDMFLVKGADMELADGKVDRGIQLSGISKDDAVVIGETSYSFDDSAVGRLISDVASWLSENNYVSTTDVFKTGDVNDIHTLIDMYSIGTNQCFVEQNKV